MKTYLKYLFPVFICLLMLGCTKHIKPEKFDIDSSLLRPFKSSIPVQMLVPTNAETKYLVEFSGKQSTHAEIFVDLNDLYNNAKELMEDVWIKHHIPVSSNAKKYLKFTITKIQWEVWAGGFSIGSYLEFDIETGDGYKKHYKVQDQSASGVERAVGGTISRAVETILQDEKIIDYIESNN